MSLPFTDVTFLHNKPYQKCMDPATSPLQLKIKLHLLGAIKFELYPNADISMYSKSQSS